MEARQHTAFAHRTVAELVTEDYRRATVFKRFGIDFCCGGGRTVEAACKKKGIDPAEIERALLTETPDASAGLPDPRRWSPDFLADYIVNEHHRYVREQLPILQQFSRKVARVHGAAHPELVEIDRLFGEVAAELTEHLAKEEQVLFPYIKQLVAAQDKGKAAASPDFDTAREPIAMMEEEHDHAGELMRQIRALTSDFTPPEHACNTYRALFVNLEAFEADLHRHVHLENNVLFPKTLELEEKLTAQPA